nr:hypothetical protein [Segatella maculosa]
MKKNVCNFLAVLCLLMGTVTMVSCSKDDDATGGKQEPVVQMNLDEKAKTATIAVNKLDANTHVQLVYATARGQVLAEALPTTREQPCLRWSNWWATSRS